MSVLLFDSSLDRYVFRVVSTTTAPVAVKWDDDDGSARGVTMAVWRIRSATDFSLLGFGASVSLHFLCSGHKPKTKHAYLVS